MPQRERGCPAGARPLLPSGAAVRASGSPHPSPSLPPPRSYSLAYLWTITRTFRTLLKLPYNMMRRANLVVRIQVGTEGLACARVGG